MKTVILYGELAKRFGKTHKFAAQSAAECVRALCVNFPGFQQYMITSKDRGMGFKVKVARELLSDAKETQLPSGKSIVKIIPVLIGSGAKTKIILGGALIVAGIVVSAFGGGAIGGYMINIGAGLVLGGIVQMLSPAPKKNNPSESERPEDRPSYLFDGPVNTTAQGHPVPLGYGKMTVGSAVISAGLTIEDAS